MPRINPDNRTPNPSFRFYEWKGKTGVIQYYDKIEEKNVVVGKKFPFVLLDELATIKGFNKQADSGLYSNEVRDINTEPLTVKIFKGNIHVAEGLYRDIKEHITSKNVGGVFALSLYIAVRDGERLRIANLCVKGASLGAWFDFRKTAGKELYTKAIYINGSKHETNGDNAFETPIFTLRELTPESDDEAGLLQIQVKEYLKSYLKRTAAIAPKEEHEHHQEEPEHDEAPTEHERGEALPRKPKPTDPDPSDVDDPRIPF